jgi:uncharacterized protein YndB with AHSA1/START domain
MHHFSFHVIGEEERLMVKIRKSIAINAPVEKVFNYVDDPMSQLEWLSSIMEVDDVSGPTLLRLYQAAPMEKHVELGLPYS